MSDHVSQPLAKFCWFCGFYMGKSARPVVINVDGHNRTAHKTCAKLRDAAYKSYKEEDFHVPSTD